MTVAAVLCAAFSVAATSAETTEAEIKIQINDSDGSSDSATVPLNVTNSPPAIVGENQPTQTDDIDQEGVYEDINGDGTFNVVDVGAFFNNYESDAVQNNTAAFDYNGDGSVSIIDVGLMFDSL